MKIATCCYCGTRAALRLRGEGRHELACSACGAPLHEMKWLRSETVDPAATPRTAPRPHETWGKTPKPKKRKKGRPRRRGPRRLMRSLSDLFDEIEDILD